MRPFRLILFISLAHLLALILIGKKSSPKQQTLSPQKVAVQTIILSQKPPPPSPKPQTEKPQPQKPPVAPSKPLAKKTTAKKPAAKKPTTKKEVTPQKKSQDQLLSIAKSTLAQLETPASKTLPKLQSSSTPIEVHEASYSDQIIAYIQDQLTLPERGEIKIRLTITREGKVTNFTILSATDNSRSYIEKALPGIVLPSFGNRFKGEKNHTFSLTLTTLCD